ncbi:GreA/GreB family elongation factor [Dokdonella immobilis]|uniref:GreA/GreB family elongation factor n=2 Tax=Dokdonella immobilis TaxID=578942 RepID=A0A1I4VZV5_9GAMM|nr:GreA/GreB family elongation factor [Dokdonella immobilis]
MKKKPEITLSRVDAERLERMLESPDYKSFPGRRELEEEIARARIVEPTQVPASVVTMNSSVRFRIASSGSTFSLTLVYPRDAGRSSDTISILAPVGSALLGLSEGDEIAWPAPGGGMLNVEIVEVTYQPERSGDFAA